MGKKIIITGLLFAILGAGGFFIYEKYINQFSSFKKDVIEVVFAENIYTYNPYTFTEVNDQRLRYIYEPLVKLNKDLKIEPAIANSYGQLNETTWEFKLNPQVKFHDNTPISSEIVKLNFEKFKNIKALESLVSSIQKVEVIDDLTFQIITKFPDASLLSKIALLFITPNQPVSELEDNPNGTGPYTAYKIRENKLSLIENLNYYGIKPKYPKLQLTTISDQFSRIDYALNSDRVVMLYPIASDFANEISASKFNSLEFPTTTTNFFVFNRNTKTFENQYVRQFFTQIINEELIRNLTGGLGTVTSQFVAGGVFGFNQYVVLKRIANKDLLSEVKKRNLVGFKFTIVLPVGLEVFKQILEEKFRNSGLSVTIDTVLQSEISTKEVQSKYDLIFLGWKSDFGDSASFLESMVLENAGLNNFGYNNEQVNSLINAASTATNENTRLQKLREANSTIVLTDPFGIPLFETKTIYAVSKKYEYLPRLDGFVDVSNLILTQI